MWNAICPQAHRQATYLEQGSRHVVMRAHTWEVAHCSHWMSFGISGSQITSLQGRSQDPPTHTQVCTRVTHRRAARPRRGSPGSFSSAAPLGQAGGPAVTRPQATSSRARPLWFWRVKGLRGGAKVKPRLSRVHGASWEAAAGDLWGATQPPTDTGRPPRAVIDTPTQTTTRATAMGVSILEGSDRIWGSPGDSEGGARLQKVGWGSRGLAGQDESEPRPDKRGGQ